MKLKLKKNKFIKDFKDFAFKGNVLDLAVGVIIGAAFGKIVSSLVSDIFMPLLGILTGSIHLTGAFFALDGQYYASQEAAAAAGVSTLNYGVFLQNVFDFLLIAMYVFIIVRYIGKLMHQKPAPDAPPAPKCPFCRQEITEDATRCPHCTSELPKAEANKA